MNIICTPIQGLFIIEPKVFEDARGYFFESFNKKTFSDAGIDIVFHQDNQSKSSFSVMRGLHYQLEPHSQTKLVRVIHGKILDVAVDIRKGSPTFGKYFSVELTCENKKQLFIPKGFAHGFSVLSQTAIVFYKCDELFHPPSERGINLKDPSVGINWGVNIDNALISERDNKLPFLNDAEMNFIFHKK